MDGLKALGSDAPDGNFYKPALGSFNILSLPAYRTKLCSVDFERQTPYNNRSDHGEKRAPLLLQLRQIAQDIGTTASWWVSRILLHEQ